MGALVYAVAASADSTLGPKLLWEHDARAVTGTTALAGVTSLSGLTVAVTDSDTPTTWEQQPTTGIALAGGWGRLLFTLAHIRTDLMTRAIDPRDCFIFEVQLAQTGWDASNAYAILDIYAREATAGTAYYESIGSGLRLVSPSVVGVVNYYPGHSGWVAPLLSLNSTVSGSVQMTSTGQSAIGRLSDANLPSGEPIEGDSFTTIQTSANVVRSAAGLGVWAPTNDAPPEWMLTINTAGGAGTGYCEVMRLWLLPGVEY